MFDIFNYGTIAPIEDRLTCWDHAFILSAIDGFVLMVEFYEEQ